MTKRGIKAGIAIILTPLVTTVLVWALTLGGFDLKGYLHSEFAIGVQLLAIIIAILMTAVLSQDN